MNRYAHEIIRALYDRLMYEDDIALVDEMFYVYGWVEFNVVKARIRRRVNSDFIRRACIRMPGAFGRCKQ